MARLLFEKTGNAVWISHLDLMRLFQRAFKRAGFLLTHTQGFNPRPSVSIALPLSVGVESDCELLDFDLVGDAVACEEICSRLNQQLIAGVRVLQVYDTGRKLKELSLLSGTLALEYDNGVPGNAVQTLKALFKRQSLIVEKKGKNGLQEQDIIPMLKKLEIRVDGERELMLDYVVCCQNPWLNPMQLAAAIARYHPELKPDFVRCKRVEIYDSNGNIFR